MPVSQSTPGRAEWGCVVTTVFHAGTEGFGSSGIKLTDGTVVGEVRSANTVIIAGPSPTRKPIPVAGYRWRAADTGHCESDNSAYLGPR